jgi:hypothetical protein
MFHIRNGLKQGNALSPLLFNFALEYTISRVQVNQDGLKLSGIHQLLVYANYVNMLGGSVRTRKENTEALVVASQEIGLEVNADKTKYLATSRDQDVGRSHSMKIDNSFFERVEEYNPLNAELNPICHLRALLGTHPILHVSRKRVKYMGTALTNQNSIQEDIKRRLKSGNVCYYSV